MRLLKLGILLSCTALSSSAQVGQFLAVKPATETEITSRHTIGNSNSSELCEVFSSPAEYNHKVITIEGILAPSVHSLFLSSFACNAKGGPDFTTQAVLPGSWETLPHGKELRKYLHRGKAAAVKLTGTFEADPQRYGPDGARFRFVISGISTVGPAPSDFRL